MIGQEDTSVAKHVIDRFEELKQLRNRKTDELTMVSRLFRPQRNGFNGAKPGDWNLHQLFNSSTLQNAGNFTASLYTTLCSPGNKWMQATTPDADLAEFRDVKVWMDVVTRRMLASFMPALSSFYNAAVSWAADVPILGTGAMVSDMGQGRKKFTDRCLDPSTFVFDVDADNMPNELIVERMLTPVQAARFYGADALPEKIRDKAASGKADEKHPYLQAYQLNDEFNPSMIGRRGMEFLSTHVCVEGKCVVRQGGVHEQNFAIPRWDGDDVWGTSLGYLNLASAVKLQIQERDNSQASALAARPPIGTTGTSSAKRMAKLAPGKHMHGAISYSGQQLMKPIFTMNGLPITVDMARMSKEEVEQGWHAQLLTLVGRTGLGNLEVMERMEERLRLQAPFLGRMQTEGLAPILERRFAMLYRAGQLPPPPKELKGQPLEMKFTSVAAMAQKAQEGVAVSRILEDTAKLAATQPDPKSAAEVWDVIDTDYAQQVLREARGADTRVHRSKEAIEARRQARDQAEQAQQAMAAAQAGGGIAKDLAAAQGATGGGGPGQ